jgi:lipopolysaccharide export system protein LptC
MIACAPGRPEMADTTHSSGLAPLTAEMPPRRVAAPDGRHSRFVALMKLLLPAVAAVLLLLIAAWPRLELAMGHLRFTLPKIDMRDARDLHMVNARYSGIDKHHRPYVVTADVARQMPNQSDLMSLEGPKADITLNSGAWVAMTGDTGVYLTQGQVLDLYGNVKLFHDRGYDLNTDSAHIDLAAGTAEGHDPVQGQGTLGDITSEGFRLIDHGGVIIFTGKAKLHLLPRPARAAR